MRATWEGYVVTKPLDERPAPYQLLVEDGRMLDVDVSAVQVLIVSDTVIEDHV